MHEKRTACRRAQDDPQGRPSAQGSRVRLQRAASECVEVLSMTPPPEGDPFELRRFLDAQLPIYSQVIEELSAGRKRSHWMWFIFPQIAGLGSSAMAQRFAIGFMAEAIAHLADG